MVKDESWICATFLGSMQLGEVVVFRLDDH